MRARTRMVLVVVCLVTAVLLVVFAAAGNDTATATPEDGPAPVATYTPDEPVQERGPVVERDGDGEPGELPSERDVPTQPTASPGDNDTIGDPDLRPRRELDVDGAIGGTPPRTPVVDRIRDVVLLIGVVVLLGAAAAAGAVLWRQDRG